MALPKQNLCNGDDSPREAPKDWSKLWSRGSIFFGSWWRFKISEDLGCLVRFEGWNCHIFIYVHNYIYMIFIYIYICKCILGEDLFPDRFSFKRQWFLSLPLIWYLFFDGAGGCFRIFLRVPCEFGVSKSWLKSPTDIILKPINAYKCNMRVFFFKHHVYMYLLQGIYIYTCTFTLVSICIRIRKKVQIGQRCWVAVQLRTRTLASGGHRKRGLVNFGCV